MSATTTSTIDVVNVPYSKVVGCVCKSQQGRSHTIQDVLTPKKQKVASEDFRQSEFMDANELSWGSSSTQTTVPLSSSTFESELDESIDDVRRSSGISCTFSTPIELGRPDGLSGGFYELMQQTRQVRVDLARKLLTSNIDDCDLKGSSALREALDRLQSIPRPCGWTLEDDEDLHVLSTASKMHAIMRLAYEKCELRRDLQFLQGGDTKVLELMRAQHTRVMNAKATWVEKQFPSWETSINRALRVMRVAAATTSSRAPFRNLITDRDGTINNYCDRYPSSLQSLYNAVWIGRFSHQCTENTLLITAAPLGGRQDAVGLIDLCTMPPGVVKYSGSKGREYYDHDHEQVVEIEPLSIDMQDLLDSLYTHLVSLCKEARNSVFTGLGSGLQRKFGEITIARNDPSSTISECESRRFLDEVRQVISEVDPAGVLLDMHDTETDIEIFPRMADGRPSFDKGIGVSSLNARLGLGIDVGPNLVCGDTPSDVPMIEATLSLITNRPATNLGVLFIITPEQHARTPQLAEKVCSLCSDNGAHYAILPSPDVLVAALAEYTKQVSKI